MNLAEPTFSGAPYKLTRIPSLKSVAQFRAHLESLGLQIPCDENLQAGLESPLAHSVAGLTINGKTIGNRFAVQPMEGWDGTTTGGVTPEMTRRWERFGLSGAKLIYGGEAMAVRPDGRANPNQLIISPENLPGIRSVVTTLKSAHRNACGSDEDLVIGFQLTHSGRFCRPNDKKTFEPKVAYRHPLLDKKFRVTSDEQVWSDSEIEQLIADYVSAAKLAGEAGADFVDIKHCHGYLLHEFLSAFTRTGKYGGSFENRTRILREIVQGIRQSGNNIDIGVRLSAFDMVPFRPDPNLSQPGKLGPGVPEEYQSFLPYRYAFGTNIDNPLEPDLRETLQFVDLCIQLGVKLLNISAGSPYYNPHIQRPAAYPPSDGYQPAHDPLIDVHRQIQVTRTIKQHAGSKLVVVGSGYTYLQDFLPHVSQAVLREGWLDVIGIGRMTLSYPEIFRDVLQHGKLQPKGICRTFSDCTTAPRNGLISGCYPLDKFYSARPEFQQLKEIKKQLGA